MRNGTRRSSIAMLMIAACAMIQSSVASSVHKLTDKTFEHDTQAASGQTTGVWAVRLCETCDAHAEIWEALSAYFLEKQIFFGEVDVKKNTGVKKRFGHVMNTGVMLLRNRKMYVYRGLMIEEDVKAWIEQGWENGRELDVPAEPSLSDKVFEVFSIYVAKLASMQARAKYIISGVAVAFLVLVYLWARTEPEPEALIRRLKKEIRAVQESVKKET